MNISLLRLITNEFVLADIESESESNGTMTLRDPVVMMIGKDQVGFAQFNPFGVEDTIELYTHNIIYRTKPSEDLVAEYTRVFSRIQIAPANAIQ